jgi:hypothetical protein
MSTRPFLAASLTSLVCNANLNWMRIRPPVPMVFHILQILDTSRVSMFIGSYLVHNSSLYGVSSIPFSSGTRGLVVSCAIFTLATGVEIQAPAGDFMSRHMPPASPQEVGACCIVCPFVFQCHWGRCTCLENGNVVNVDVNPFPSPHFHFPSIARCWRGCSPLRGHGVQLGMQTEGHKHNHKYTFKIVSTQ